MNQIVGVILDTEESMIYFETNGFNVKKNLTVIVETEKGENFGKVVTDAHPIDKTKLNQSLRKIIRIATKKDYFNYKNNKRQAESALIKCKSLVKKYNLSMSIVSSQFTFDRDQLIFQFTAESRIDFRELARELASIYKTRIELRQIGVRDKAKKICGYGSCGQKLCCARFLNQFDSVSISMAKNQNISLTPSKINGVCGRLLCCLKYENETYKECRKNLPELGKITDTEYGKCKVIGLNILKNSYTIIVPEIGLVEVKK